VTTQNSVKELIAIGSQSCW